jgi:hypothetical protein
MKHLVLAGAAAAAAGIAVALVVAGRALAAPEDAGAQADAGIRIFPGQSEVMPSGLVAQTQEPADGFTGACLLDYMPYKPTLPLICYSPGPNGQYDAGLTTVVTFKAPEVFRSYGNVASQYDSYQVLATCYPPDPVKGCDPSQSFAISRSCCDYGVILTSLDGKTASGTANFGFVPGGAASDAGLDAAEQ